MGVFLLPLGRRVGHKATIVVRISDFSLPFFDLGADFGRILFPSRLPKIPKITNFGTRLQTTQKKWFHGIFLKRLANLR